MDNSKVPYCDSKENELLKDRHRSKEVLRMKALIVHMYVRSLQMRGEFVSMHRRERKTPYLVWDGSLKCARERRGTSYLKEEARAGASPCIGSMLTNDEVSHIMAPEGWEPAKRRWGGELINVEVWRSSGHKGVCKLTKAALSLAQRRHSYFSPPNRPLHSQSWRVPCFIPTARLAAQEAPTDPTLPSD